ncbi:MULTISPECIES: Gfo/Idh/MocA family protein [Alicyclobacillus]|uniref:Gfo/Idh/MocA family oxidoreductase n=1 Tax=Alicyclobacillus acidoterrestris (strain ATCC 49025 / DSM 3922 / CIP 106132 / NCIMB 13137 / GD3B) TaxID=1356854 RepID=T0BM61_ALIAG|nr:MULTISPECIES: Gfo/Idh/MocA family oxidoreductase [Alicyclobacillus]EPZ41595.1 oxidoreductase [Alicyclobacillus acidoterrestris ATCC 49025]UNO48228.1 Gfo/Idh/MocA family oxidoreductase [Alicyclobacillus acidoterrestris]
MTETLRVGIVGAGGIAQAVHIPNYQKCGDKVNIVAIADVDLERAKDVAKRYDIPHAYATVDEMLGAQELDAVSICTPNKFHAASAIAALQAGCHVLCEKPPAMTVAEAEAMASAAEKANKYLSYGFHYRHTQDVEALKRFIDAGELGDIYAATAIAMRRRGIPGWGVFTNKELQGGGPLIDIGVHMLDTALYLMGYPEPDSVFGATYQKLGTKPGVGLLGAWDYENFTVEDMARGFIRFKNGATLVLEAAFAANVEQRDEMNVKLMGDLGGANVFPLTIYQEKHGSLVDVKPAYLPDKPAYELEVERFVDACLGGAAPISTPEQGVKLQRIINGLYASAESGEAVKL